MITYAERIAALLLDGCDHGDHDCLCKIAAALARKQRYVRRNARPTEETP